MNVLYALGSTNAAKEAATEQVLADYEESYEVVTVDVDPGIAAMPMERENARQGARNRARRAAATADADRGIGVEGYVEDGAFLSVWAAVFGDGAVIGEGGAGRIRLPDSITSRIPDEELGEVIADVAGEEGIREREGTVGVMTDGRLTRTEFTARALGHAMEHVLGNEV
ncbi:MAG: DUF84 family protein [Candidatus Nanohaloarchaea archaeon]|nr:DUF84 family protein [Candidatus Nanohaloarchaea archaeon]